MERLLNAQQLLFADLVALGGTTGQRNLPIVLFDLVQLLGNDVDSWEHFCFGFV
jgi:hypothetical protein